jgi:alpha-beta hydrolase superfamily lysophospholipase
MRATACRRVQSPGVARDLRVLNVHRRTRCPGRPRKEIDALYEGHYHDLLNDIGKEGVIANIKAWVDRHMPA